jgi:acyl-CoA thioesterase-1
VRPAADLGRALGKRWTWLKPLVPAAVIAASWTSCSSGSGPLVAFLGDSLTSGWRLPEEEAWPAVLARGLAEKGRPIRVINAGVSGDTAAKALARLPAVLEHRPDVLVVALGTNDALLGLPLESTEQALDRIVALAQAAHARVLLVGIRLATGESGPLVGPAAGDAAQARRLAELYPRVATSRRVALVPDLLAGVAGEPALLFPDRLHPNAAGHRRIADNVRLHVEIALAEVEGARR